MTPLSDDEIDQLERQQSGQRPLSDSEMDALAANQQPQQESSWYSQFLNPARKDMPIDERLSRLAEATLGGAAVAAPLGATVGLIGGPGAPATSTAGALAFGGAGALGGLASEGYKQLASQFFDSTPEQQEIGGLLAGGISPQSIGGTVKGAGKLLSSYGPTYLLRKFGKDVGNALEDGIDPALAPAIRAAKERMSQGGLEASTSFGQSVLNAFNKEMKSAEKQAFDSTILAQKQADTFAKLKNSAANELEFTYLDEAQRASQAYADKLKEGLPAAKTPHDVGAEMRIKAESIVNPKMAARKQAYDDAYKTWSSSEQAAEKAGQYWATSPEGMKVRDAILELAKGRSRDAKSALLDVANQIWKPVEKEVTESTPVAGLGSMFTVPTKKTVTSIKPAEATVVDDLIRDLGRVYEKDAPTGYAALKGGLDKKVRSLLTDGVDGQGGIYSRFGLGEGKAGYKKASEEMQNFMNSSEGLKLLSKQFGTDFYKATNDDVAKYFMKDESTLRNAQRLYEDPKLVGNFVEQYLQGAVKGKSPKEIDTFLARNPHFEKLYPDQVKSIRGYSGELSKLESDAAQFTGKAKQAEGMRVMPEQVEQIKPEVKDVLGVFRKDTGFNAPHTVIKSILSDERTAPQKITEAARLVQDPAQAGNFMKAIGYELSSSSPQTIMTKFEQIKPVLSNMKGVTPEHITALEGQVQAVLDAAMKKKVDPKPLLQRIFSVDNLTKIGIQGVGAIGGSLVTNAAPRNSIFGMGKQNEQR